jgi:hypothetical protein
MPARTSGELRDLILYHEIDNDLEDAAAIKRKMPSLRGPSSQWARGGFRPRLGDRLENVPSASLIH